MAKHPPRGRPDQRPPVPPQSSPKSDTLRIDGAQPQISRQQLVPGCGVSYDDKLRAAGAVDLRDNASLERLPGGYLRVTPKDPAKRHG